MILRVSVFDETHNTCIHGIANILFFFQIIHRDLAARIVFVGERERCKVTDFGMARNVHQDDIYIRNSCVSIFSKNPTICLS